MAGYLLGPPHLLLDLFDLLADTHGGVLFIRGLVGGGIGGFLLRVSDLEVVVEGVIGSRGVVQRGVDWRARDAGNSNPAKEKRPLIYGFTIQVKALWHGYFNYVENSQRPLEHNSNNYSRHRD